MSDLLNESLSQLMDGETEDADGRIIDDLLHNPGRRDTWWRYHLIADVLRHDTELLAHRNLAGRISAALEAEPFILAPRPLWQRNWVKPVAGFAIAASVAVVAILGLQQSSMVTTDSVSQMPQTVARTSVQIPETVSRPIQELTQIPTPIVRHFKPQAQLASVETREEEISPVSSPVYSRMNSYLLNYNEYRSTETQMQGMLPYVRIIAHESDR